MGQGTVGAGTADGFKTDIQQGIGGTPEVFQFLNDADFIAAGFGTITVQPAEEFDHGRTIAQVCFAGASDFDCVLARFGQHAGVIGMGDCHTGVFQDRRNGEGRSFRIDAHGASKGGQCFGEVARCDDLDIRVRAQICNLMGFADKLHFAGVKDDGKDQRHGIAFDIGAADVEQPGDAVRQGQDGGVVIGCA